MPFDKTNAAENGRKGGMETKKRLKTDPDYYSRIGTISGTQLFEERGSEYYSQISKLARRGTK